MLGVVALAAAAVGHHTRPLAVWEGAVLAAAAVALLSPEPAARVGGGIAVVASWAWSSVRKTPEVVSS